MLCSVLWVLKRLGMDYVFYVGQVTWTISLLYGIGIILIVNSIKNGVMSVYVIVIEMFITFKGAKYMTFL
jgi:hypothetical protein